MGKFRSSSGGPNRRGERKVLLVELLRRHRRERLIVVRIVTDPIVVDNPVTVIDDGTARFFGECPQSELLCLCSFVCGI